MNLPTIIQGKQITPEIIEWIKSLMSKHPEWHRSRLSLEICKQWNWNASNARPKDMACRTMLLKLERLGYLKLPPARKASGGNHYKNKTPVDHPTDPISCPLQNLTPLRIEIVSVKTNPLFKYLLDQYHYLGFTGAVGENMKYLVYDRHDRLLACSLFGAAAWKSAARDNFIGWTADKRKEHLQFVAGNMRFLILPWIQVSHLASHILGRIVRRVSQDWLLKYGHPLHLLETFVEQTRFRGTCYKAANWRCVGQTQGRSRNDRYHTYQVPVKDVYLYPLTKYFRKELSGEPRRDIKSL
jgi:hypothetical protein